MKIKCPSCSTVGRVPDDRIPESGANIRCPACSFVFFVGGAERLNIVADSTPVSSSGGAARTTTSMPSLGADAARAAAEARAPQPAQAAPPAATPVPAGPESSAEVADAGHAVPTTAAAGAKGPLYGGGASSTLTAPAPLYGGGAPTPAAAPGAGVTGSFAGYGGGASAGGSGFAGYGGGGGGFAGYGGATGSQAAVPSGSYASAPDSDERPTAAPSGAATPAVASGPDPAASAGPSTAAVSGGAGPETGPVGRARVKPAWKVRNEIGVVYDFPDIAGVKRWVESRGTLDGIVASEDGGTTWKPFSDYPDLAVLKPSGLRSTTGAMRAVRPVTGNTIPPGTQISPPSGGPTTGATPAVAPPSGSTLPPGTSIPSASEAAEHLTNATPRTSGRFAPASAKEKEEAEKKKKRDRARLGMLLGAAALVAAGAFGLQFLNSRSETGLEIPQTPVGQELRWVMTQIGGGAAAVTDATITEHFAASTLERVPAASIVEQLRYYDTWRQSYTLVRWERAPTETRIEVRMQTEGGDLGVLVVETEPNPPHRIVSLNFRGVD